MRSVVIVCLRICHARTLSWKPWPRYAGTSSQYLGQARISRSSGPWIIDPRNKNVTWAQLNAHIPGWTAFYWKAMPFSPKITWKQNINSPTVLPVVVTCELADHKVHYYTDIHRSKIRILWISILKKIMNFTEFKKMPSEFYFEIQYFNFDKKFSNTSSQTQSDSNQCYSESELATARSSHLTVVSI